MTKKKVFWIIFSLLLLALLLVLGSYLTKNTQSPEKPPVVEATEPTGKTEPSSSQEETEESSLEEASSEDGSQPSGDAQTTESSQSTAEPSSQQPADFPQPPTAPPTTPPTSGPDEDLQARIDELIAEVYALRDYYIAQLAYLEAYARTEYEGLSPDERTPERKQDIALACIDQAYALENECDSRMDAICNELAYLLLEIDGDLTLVNDIRYAYASEKEAAKSEFLEKYADYFG